MKNKRTNFIKPYGSQIMRMNKFIFIFLLLGLSFSSTGQKKEQPVEWTFSVFQSERPTVMTISADIQPGWFIYATTTPKGGPIATSFTFDDPQLRPDKMMPKGELIIEQSELFEMEVHKYKNHVDFVQNLPTSDVSKVSGTVRYMCCNSVKCLPPTSVPFEIKIQD